jgi:hypothetical protein
MAKDKELHAADAMQTTTTADVGVVKTAPTRAAEPMPKFRVVFAENEAIVYAANDREAWAKFCDGNKFLPTPKAGKVFIVNVAGTETQVYPPVKQ